MSNSILCKLAELVFWCTPCLIIVENGWHHSKNGGYQLDILLTIPFWAIDSNLDLVYKD